MSIDKKSIESIRFLAVDAVNKANSGHPGLPMGAATMAYVLFKEHMNFNPKDPQWLNRDRFILSAGHGSMLLYALLHLYGYDLSMDEIKNFRQLGSKTPGHPEYGITPGVEMTTGPLGQGIAASVGFAMAEARRHAETKGAIDHYTYVLCGDGDLMEGVSYEACSLAGHLALNKLIVLYDSNNVTIDGRTDLTFTENVRARFEAMHWNTLLVEDGNDYEAINHSISLAKQSDRPTLIEVKTIIGYGSINKADKSAAHGAPLGLEEARITKEAFGWDGSKQFYIPKDVQDHFKAILKEKKRAYQAWMKKHGELSFSNQVSPDALKDMLKVATGDKPTRSHGEAVINALYPHARFMFGGSADLEGSNLTGLKQAEYFSSETRDAANVHFGIREFSMACIVNGISLYGGFRSFAATFLSFADYMKPAIRLASIMNIPSVFIFTHDSIGVGEDGPTHQPIEQALMLRSIPGVEVYRPADGQETAMAYYKAFSGDRPACILLSRQKLPELGLPQKNLKKGGYIAFESATDPELILMASGSELAMTIEAAKILSKKWKVRVVSMLSMEVFNKQSQAYRDSVLPKAVTKRFAVEALSPFSWYPYIGNEGAHLSMDRFGESAPGKLLYEHFGFTEENIVKLVRRYMKP